jgi:hypothetical protein
MVRVKLAAKVSPGATRGRSWPLRRALAGGGHRLEGDAVQRRFEADPVRERERL